MKKGRIFIVSSPSGTGKTTLVEMLCREFSNCVRSISCTTRKPRSGEKEGIDYFFLSKEEFLERDAKGDFLESAKVFEDYYGTLKESVTAVTEKGRHIFLVIDTQGAEKLRGKVDACFIFILPPNEETLTERLKKRATESDEARDLRLSWAKKELAEAKYYDYQIVNDDLQKAYETFKEIVLAETNEDAL